MGRLVVFNRRIDLAGDDLYVPAFYGVMLHTIWITLIAIVYYFLHSDEFRQNCQVAEQPLYFVWIYLINLSVELPLEILILVLSMMGTVANKGPRRWLSPLVHIHFFVLMCEYAILWWGVFVISTKVVCTRPNTGQKFSNSVANVMVNLVVIWGILALSFYLFFFMLFMLGSKTKKRAAFDKYLDLWKRRFELFCGTLGTPEILKNGKDTLADLSKQMADYFHDVDWSPSDILVGLILLKREQKRVQRRREATKAYKLREIQTSVQPSLSATMVTSPAISLPSSFGSPTETIPSHARHPSRGSITPTLNTVDSQTDLIKRKMSDAVIVPVSPQHIDSTHPLAYGPMASTSTLPTSTSSTSVGHMPLASEATMNSLLGSRFENNAPITHADIVDVLYFARYAELVYNHTEAKALGKSVLLHFNEDNDLFKSPYLIAYDHDWQCIVIAVRGTYSTADLLVDFKFQEAPLHVDEDPDGRHFCHSGMLVTAENIYSDIETEKILQRVLSPESAYSHYRVVVCGHSLGAGVAALLCYKLRKSGYGRALCYSYNPPSQLVSVVPAVLFEEFCISVVIGDDLVSRLSPQSMEILKIDVRRLINNCDRPKWEIFKSVLGNHFFKWTTKKQGKMGAAGLQRQPTDLGGGTLQRSGNGSGSGKDTGGKSTLQRVQSPTAGLESVELSDIDEEQLKRRTVSIRRDERGVDLESQLANMSKEIPRMYIAGRILYLEKITKYLNLESTFSIGIEDQDSTRNPFRKGPQMIRRAILKNRELQALQMSQANDSSLSQVSLDACAPSSTLPKSDLARSASQRSKLNSPRVAVPAPTAGNNSSNPSNSSSSSISGGTLTRYQSTLTRREPGMIHSESDKYQYVPRWASRDEFQEIQISRSMLSDHRPFDILKELWNTPPGKPLKVYRN
ncbi:uncharacterized protein BJ171DRAFT_145313 [Polychytrium aggregatum]|uniref:uncharacterized protein n=1 Tax=Polychytrium aggregatum TaxID=110093 RepID=UPI0022FE2D8B|nr:uncharacterized protein BJ171DRAFT_145313 [Polychytrium aggregatum]KAI9203526.1 hypothetical protein BJ171DRAFT_145313 [Polychytrium aggregatum]